MAARNKATEYWNYKKKITDPMNVYTPQATTMKQTIKSSSIEND